MATEMTYRKAKVWNRNTEEYSQIVKGEKVHIPAGGSLTVSRRQALDIRGHYPGKNVITRIEIEPILEAVNVQEDYVDHRTGKTFSSKESLLKHLGVDPMLVNKPAGFDCVICNKNFDNKDELVAHLADCVKWHSNKKPEVATAKK